MEVVNVRFVPKDGSGDIWIDVPLAPHVKTIDDIKTYACILLNATRKKQGLSEYTAANLKITETHDNPEFRLERKTN